MSDAHARGAVDLVVKAAISAQSQGTESGGIKVRDDSLNTDAVPGSQDFEGVEMVILKGKDKCPSKLCFPIRVQEG